MIFIIPSMIVATAVGFLLHQKWPRQSESGADLMMKGILYLVAPVLIIISLTRFEVNVENVGGILCIQAAAVACGFTAFFLGRKLGMADYQAASLTNAAMLFNAGFGTAIVGVFLGVEQLPDAVALDMLGHMPLIVIGAFAVGAIYGRDTGDNAKQKIKTYVQRNPLLYAAIIGLIMPKEWLSDQLFEVAAIATAWSVVFAFFTVGVKLRAELANDEPLPALALPLATVLRFVIAPTLAFVLMSIFIGQVNDAYLLSFAAAPVAYNSLLVAHTFKLSQKIAVFSLVLTTVLSFVGVGVVLIAF